MWIKPRLIVLDESGDWSPNLVEKAGGIFGVYIYDSNTVINLCELQGSYLLNAFEVQTGNSDISEKIKEEVEEEWRKSIIDQDFQYVHTNIIDKLPSFPLTSIQVKKEEYDDKLQELIQAYRENCPYYDEVEWEVDMAGYLVEKSIRMKGFTKTHVARKIGLPISCDKIKRVA